MAKKVAKKDSKKFVVRDIVKTYADKNDFAYGRVHEFAKDFISEIHDTIVGLDVGDKLFVNGVGTFQKVHKDARKARNPKTGEAIKIPAKDVIKFKISNSLKNS